MSKSLALLIALLVVLAFCAWRAIVARQRSTTYRPPGWWRRK